jgi:hypothetical protein
MFAASAGLAGWLLLHAARNPAAVTAAISLILIRPPFGDALIIDYDGKQYQFSLDDVTIRQAMAIEKFMGCPFAEWGKRLQKGDDLPARQALGWLILHPDGKTPIGDTDFKLVALGAALEAAFAAEEAAAGEPERPTAAASNGRSLQESSPVS